MNLFVNFFIITAVSFLLTCLASAAPTLSINPLNTVVSPSEEFKIDLIISGSDTDLNGGIFAAAGGISYNPSIIDYVPDSLVLDDIWDISELKTETRVGYFALFDTVLPKIKGKTGDIFIASLIFKAIGPGKTDLTLKDPNLDRLGDDFLTWDDEVPFDDKVQFAHGQVEVVPIPSSFLIFLGGIVSLVGMVRRKRNGIIRKN